MLMGKTLNGNIMCVVYLKTTGKSPEVDECYSVSILPLDLDYSPIIGAMFERYIQVSPDNEKKVKVEDRVFARKHSVVWDQFDTWFEEKIKKSQIIPIVYDWPLTRKFLVNLFSEPGCEIAFCEKARDLKVICNFLNDYSEAHNYNLPFSKTTLSYILNNCNFPISRKSSSLDIAYKMSQAYKKLIRSDPSFSL